MNKKQCKDALDFYKKFLVRMDRVAEFLKVAENVGIDKGDIPDLTKVHHSATRKLDQMIPLWLLDRMLFDRQSAHLKSLTGTDRFAKTCLFQ